MRQWAVGSGQWAVGSGQGAVAVGSGSGQWAVNGRFRWSWGLRLAGQRVSQLVLLCQVRDFPKNTLPKIQYRSC